MRSSTGIEVLCSDEGLPHIVDMALACTTDIDEKYSLLLLVLPWYFSQYGIYIDLVAMFFVMYIFVVAILVVAYLWWWLRSFSTILPSIMCSGHDGCKGLLGQEGEQRGL
jgi:hypothetical protein